MLKKLAVACVLITSLLASQLQGFAWQVRDLLYQNDFEDGIGLPWHVSEALPSKTRFEVSDGKYKIEVLEKGTEMWDIQLRHRGIKLQNGHKYTVKFKVKASNACRIYPKIGDQYEPYFEDWNYNNRSWSLMPLAANIEKSVNESFTATRTADTCEFAFYLSDSTIPVGTVFEFDDIYLEDTAPPVITPKGSPDLVHIHVNQLGYFVSGIKKATFHCKETTSLDWILEDSNKKIVEKGKTTVFGEDKDSGEFVHIIDFTSFKTEGKGYILRAGKLETDNVEASINFEKTSHPFDITNDIYSQLKYDALRYFYHSRSGINIEMPYAVEKQWTRPAGHPKDVAKAVSERGYSSEHSIDVTGGWYDAGDYGKYVINGGISAWTLMNMYERAKINTQNGNSKTLEAFNNGTMNIPESENDIPDMLDEARWEMDFMLKMQIPAGLPKAGMVHHKIHDEKWIGLAFAPHEDTEERILKPPTTSATLNLAATGAQAYRIWKDIDEEFANKCLIAAETAWKAALENPDMVAPFDDSIGGTPYGDDYFQDEFYWAAAELFISTDKNEYLNYIKGSKHYLEVPLKIKKDGMTEISGSFDWSNTAALGTISLALVKGNLNDTDVNIAKANILKSADNFISIQKKQGYGINIEQSPLNDEGLIGYPWFSNSFVLNQCILFAYAYDFSGENEYIAGATEAMDYILGRNPLSKSYVSEYGENCLEYPHHRFFAYQENPNYPKCPPGFVSSGPNSGLEDPWVKGSGWLPGELPPQKCYMDHIEAWSTNEVAINLNAPLAWVTAYLDEVGRNVVYASSNKGDLNSDNLVDSTDLALLKRIILSITNNANLRAADINDDGEINSIDLAMLKRRILNVKLLV